MPSRGAIGALGAVPRELPSPLSRSLVISLSRSLPRSLRFARPFRAPLPPSFSSLTLETRNTSETGERPSLPRPSLHRPSPLMALAGLKQTKFECNWRARSTRNPGLAGLDFVFFEPKPLSKRNPKSEKGRRPSLLRPSLHRQAASTPISSYPVS